MRLELSSELNVFRADVRAFIATHAPGPKTHAGVRSPDAEALPAIRAWTAALFEAGYLGIDWPVAFGGRPDAHPMEPFIVAEEIARARTWPPIGAFGLAAGAIIEFGSHEQQSNFLPRMRRAEDIWCQLFSEPDAGSDLASLRTRAVRDNDEFVIDGQKVWTTNGQHADMGYLLARTDSSSSKHHGITAFAMDMRSPGVQVRPLREITGTTDFNEVFLDSVRIPAGNVIGSVNDGWRVANSSLRRERFGVGASGIELMRQFADLVALASQRGLDDSDTDQVLGELATRVHVNLAIAALVRSRTLATTGSVSDAALSKIFFSEINHDMAVAGMELQGADGILTEGDPGAVADGWWQDAYLYARAYTIAGGANEVLRTVVAERGLGLPREAP